MRVTEGRRVGCLVEIRGKSHLRTVRNMTLRKSSMDKLNALPFKLYKTSSYELFTQRT